MYPAIYMCCTLSLSPILHASVLLVFFTISTTNFFPLSVPHISMYHRPAGSKNCVEHHWGLQTHHLLRHSNYLALLLLNALLTVGLRGVKYLFLPWSFLEETQQLLAALNTGFQNYLRCYKEGQRHSETVKLKVKCKCNRFWDIPAVCTEAVLMQILMRCFIQIWIFLTKLVKRLQTYQQRLCCCVWVTVLQIWSESWACSPSNT